ncbi:hypothetical protein [Kutzneria chonburiensis]|uniref:Uncharacterized protein n=1 Tax=Kutzneria chonburiensis TaxID=1483604 RepID=A0ABV6MNF5_9PSEU|nr:hypothetical protein [Kutzneria chonburiensis]
MAIWEHDGQMFEYISTYCLPEDAWHHEVTGLSASAYICLVIPDLTPDGPFTPAPPDNATLRFFDSTIPWPIWTKFMTAVQDSRHFAEG